MEFLAALLHARQPLKAVMDMDWELFSATYEHHGPKPLLEHVRPAAGGQSAGSGTEGPSCSLNRTELAATVKEIVEEAAGGAIEDTTLSLQVASPRTFTFGPFRKVDQQVDRCQHNSYGYIRTALQIHAST